MRIQDFTYLLENPQTIDGTKIEQLEEVIKAFPYFQSARTLYLKALKSEDSYKYNEALKVTAAYSTDRSVLFNFITSSNFSNNTSLENNTSEIILENIEIIDAEIVKVLHKKITSPEIPIQKERKKVETLEIGRPLNFDNSESHSFSEWLQLGIAKPIERSAKSSKKSIKFDLIDKFIASNPKIKPVKDKDATFQQNKPLSTDNSHLMTETLALVYLEQKKYKSAIQAYRILSLKYPEKSSFFANRIKAIKLLDKK